MYQLKLDTEARINQWAKKYDFEEAKPGEVYLLIKLNGKPYGIGPIESSSVQDTISRLKTNGYECIVLTEQQAKLTHINMCRSPEMIKMFGKE